MDLFEAIANRSSVRTFRDQVPDPHIIDRLLEAAIRAPNAGNLQPWRFYVASEARIRNTLAAAAAGQEHVAAAPVVVVICVEPRVSEMRYGRRGRDLYCIQDGAAAAQNLLLAAVALGLGGCWVGAFDEASVAGAIGAPPELRPIVMVPLGYPAGPLKSTSRIQLGRIVTRLD